ncbi:SUKH-3 domain-containing protein [Lentzea sp. DG1S-22]|uniref:SUKH-3 domain-containing protein n=1 Tax=Lentzea sp. DG1S-22 TaxID=3108822 RepID=UPI002E77559E|nr:SUKH-3 domain-containing protein [Lentzea sp. DG1S-22]WVH78464.1 SUKH-3 domain-containing protein [Lentzea sp. DG1S-22]
MSDLSDTAKTALLSSGWKPGRRVDISHWRVQLKDAGITMHKAAENFLAEFGGLRFAHGGTGISSARESFEIDPSLCDGEEGRFVGWGKLIGVSLVPIGELDGGRCFLGMDESGIIYLVADWLGHIGSGLAGLDGLIVGVDSETLYDHYPIR